LLAQKNESYIEETKDRPGHDFRYAVCSAKIKRELGWKPKESFDETLKKTFEFFQKNI
jgi:dTDP-glucose 4,6-dehydratase